jgi:hypothetical protein
MRATMSWMMTFVMVGVMFPSQPSQAASPRGADHYLQQSMAVVMAAATVLTRTTPLGLDEGCICVVGTPLDTDETYSLTRSFLRERTYVLFAGGDEDAIDVDLTIVDENERQIAGDTRTDRLAMVIFKPPQTGSYTIRMKLYRGKGASSFCAFVVMRVDGVNVPAINLGMAGDNLIERCRAISTLRGLAGGSAGFLDRQGHGAVWGVVLGGDESKTIRNVPFGNKPVTILAAGDTQVRDLDLFLHDLDGKLLAEDIDPDATPLLRPEAGEERYHAITIKNAGAENPITFALFAVLEDR